MEVEHYYIVDAKCGANNTFLRTEMGQVFAFGNNSDNKLGLQDIQRNDGGVNYSTPQLLDE
jgi:alpha-tubulin suppressor-like RCC1 family protein